MSEPTLSTHEKATQINLDPGSYGALAEIGAGQEVAHWFFRVGGAAGTIAKTMSAYDMTISDAIYGTCPRYVSRERLQTMLEIEFGKLQGRLNDKRGANTRFFVFADTVAARSFTRRDNCHGWLGVRFQSKPQNWPSQILVHVNLLDPENIQQQEALGIIGVNLIHGALHRHTDPIGLIGSLVDSLSNQRVEVDMIKFSGPDFEHVDNRLMALQLVQQGLAPAAMFTASGEVVQPAETLYKKSILVERGSFRPATHVNVDMLRCAMAQFVQEPKVMGEEKDIIVLLEMTLKNLTDGDKIDHRDFLDRVDTLRTLGHTVMISNFLEFHRLAAFLFSHTKKMIGIAMGIPTLKELFQERYYKDLEGGILESFGRLFKNDLKLYVYPYQEPTTGSILTTENLRVASHLHHLYAYLTENNSIQGMRGYNENYLPIFSRQVLAKIKSGDPSWQNAIPPQIAEMIKERSLFQYQSTAQPQVAAPVALNS